MCCAKLISFNTHEHLTALLVPMSSERLLKVTAQVCKTNSYPEEAISLQSLEKLNENIGCTWYPFNSLKSLAASNVTSQTNISPKAFVVFVSEVCVCTCLVLFYYLIVIQL